jgi:hypothetical protein
MRHFSRRDRVNMRTTENMRETWKRVRQTRLIDGLLVYYFRYPLFAKYFPGSVNIYNIQLSYENFPKYLYPALSVCQLITM